MKNTIKRHGDYLGNEINIGDTIVYASKIIPGMMLIAEVIKVQDNFVQFRDGHSKEQKQDIEVINLSALKRQGTKHFTIIRR